jgi:hypothetical protein
MVPLRFLPSDSYEHFFEDALVCPTCFAVTEPEWVSPTFVLPAGRADAVYTRDGALLVSRRFKEHHEHDPGVRFLTLPADPEHFRMIVDPVVHVDLEAKPLSIGEPCTTCGRASTHGSPVRLMSEGDMPDGWCRSDVLYGGLGGFPKSQDPAIFVDKALATRLKRMNRCTTAPIRRER